MGGIVDPLSGFGNPPLGSAVAYDCNPMKGKKKTPKVPGFMRHVVAENVRARMEVVLRGNPNKPKALSLRTGRPGEGGQSLSTIQRILAGTHGAGLDVLEAVADALDLSLYQLLIPQLNAENPQVVQGAMKNEELAYKRWRKAGAPTQQRVHEVP